MPSYQSQQPTVQVYSYSGSPLEQYEVPRTNRSLRLLPAASVATF